MDREGYMRSGTEGQIKVTVLDEAAPTSNFVAGVGSVIVPGASGKYLVRFEEGKHKGEEPRWVPANYVALVGRRGSAECE